MSEAITKTNLIIVLVLCFLIGYGIKEMFLTTEIERDDFSLSFKTPYLDSLEGKYGIEFVTDENGEEFAQFINVYDDEKTVLDRMAKSEYDKAIEEDLENSYDVNPDIPQEELEASLGMFVFIDRQQNKLREDAQRERERMSGACDEKIDEALDLYFEIKNNKVDDIALACDKLDQLRVEIHKFRETTGACYRSEYGMPSECSEHDL